MRIRGSITYGVRPLQTKCLDRAASFFWRLGEPNQFPLTWPRYRCVTIFNSIVSREVVLYGLQNWTGGQFTRQMPVHVPTPQLGRLQGQFQGLSNAPFFASLHHSQKMSWTAV